MKIAPIVDALRDLIPIPDDVTRDDSLTEPFASKPNRLYAWPRRLGTNQLNVELGEPGFALGPESVLRVRVMLALAAKGEPRAPRGDRALSLALDAWQADVVHTLHTFERYPAGSGVLWQDLRIEGTWPDVVRTDEVRAWGIDIALYPSEANLEAEEDSGS